MSRFAFEPTLDTAIPCTPRAPSEARRAVDEIASDVEPGLLRDVKLVVSELVTNSVRHSGSDEPIRVRAWVRPSGIKVEVADGGYGFEFPAGASADDEGGRGLMILEYVAERWGISRDTRTSVWFEVLERPTSAGAAQAG